MHNTVAHNDNVQKDVHINFGGERVLVLKFT